MKINGRLAAAVVLAAALAGSGVGASAQRRRTAPRTTRRAPAAQTQPAQSQLTGLYNLDVVNSQNPRAVAQRAASNLVFGDRRAVVRGLIARLSSPTQLAIQKRGQTIDIASSRAPRISFVADGREQTERAADGRDVRTRAVLYGEQLMVTSSGSRDSDFSVNFDPIDGGRRLRVTRRIFSQELERPLLIQSIYNKVSGVARWNIPAEPPPSFEPEVAAARDNNRQSPPPPVERRRQPNTPPVITRRPPPPVNNDSNVLSIPAGTRFTAVLNNDLSTERTREGDRFTLTVRAPAQYEGATIEGYVARVNPAGRVRGRSELVLNFERLRTRDGRATDFSGVVEGVRAAGDEGVRVESEGGVQESDSQGARTAQRVAIGAAVGAIIGAITGGGKGAAIGAAIGAGAGAGSVYVQGRDHLELFSGTELDIRATARR